MKALPKSPYSCLRNSPICRLVRANNEAEQRGATLLEFVIVFPILMLTVLALFDFVRYLTIQGILNSAANRAVSLASVVEDLDTDCNRLPADQRVNCGHRREVAIRKVLDAARELPLATMVGTDTQNDAAYLISPSVDGGNDPVREPAVEFVLSRGEDLRAYISDGVNDASSSQLTFNSENPTNQALSDILENIPLEVRLRARMHTFLPMFGEFEVQGHAAGFREPRFLTSFPARIDCNGNPIGPGDPPPATCPCSSDPNNPELVQGGSGCICNASAGLVGMDIDGVFTCVCEDPDLVSDGNGNCVCPFSNAQDAGCSASQVYDADTCSCNDCPELQTSPDGTACACPFATAEEAGCDQDQSFNPNSCRCEDCPYLQEADDSGFGCECPFTSAEEANCRDGQIFNPVNCTCNNCPNEQVANDDRTGCECPADFLTNNNCSAGERVDVNRCRCLDCPGNQTATPDGLSCECTLDSCPDEQVLDTRNCRCYSCPNNREIVDGRCECTLDPNTCYAQGEGFSTRRCDCFPCPGNQVLNGNVCECPAFQCLGGTADNYQCSCTCPSGEVLVNGVACGPAECQFTTCIIGPGGASIPE